MSSLLTQNSGLIWDQMMNSNAMLMPISQPATPPQENDAESDSFIGQSNPRPPQNTFQPIRPSPTSTPAAVSQLQQPLRPIQQRPTPPPPQQQQYLNDYGISAQPLDTRQSATPPMANIPSQPQADLTHVPFTQSGLPVGSIPDPMATNPVGQPTYSAGGVYPPPSMGSQSVGSISGPPLPPTGNIAGPPPTGNLSGPPPMGPYQNFRRQGPLQHSFVSTPGLMHPRSMPETPPPPYSPPYMVPTYHSPQQAPGAQVPAFYTAESGAPAGVPDATSGISEQPTLVLGPSDDTFHPVQCHWFFRKEVEKKHIWLPFSLTDSTALEEAFNKGDHTAIVTTDGGRYDVVVSERLRHAIYWEEEPTPVKRSSWFFKSDGQNRFIPYDEELADRIEEHYRDAVVNHRLHHRLELPNHDCIVVHNAQLVAHYQPSKHTDEWGTVVDGQMRTRVVKRGINEILKVEEGETSRIDHLVFLVHGVGGICDLKFRSLVECVDDFRSLSLSLMKTHFKSAIDEGKVGRIEFLPVSWHAKLHGDATGIDKRMQNITLPSIPKLRHFTNDTLMDIFFYTSPVYCQTIVDTVGSEINSLYQIFLQRNPNFVGRISLVGHSLGSLIAFDILSHQMSPETIGNQFQEPAVQTTVTQEEPEPEETLPDTLEAVFKALSLEEYITKLEEEKLDLATLKICSDSDLKDLGLPMGSRKRLFTFLKELDEKILKEQQKKCVQASSESSSNLGIPCSDSKMSLLNRQESITSVNYMVGVAGTGQPSVVYPKLAFQPSCLFALGSPISVFLTIRGIQTIGEDYHLPTCPSFFNIFHPFDPVAYRIETLIDPVLKIKPVLVPHHKGRKRMHLELRDSLTRMGTDLKQRLMDSLRSTWNSLSEFARAHRSSAEQLEAEVDRVVNEELIAHQAEIEDTESTVSGTDIASQEDLQIGLLNGGRRIDYVLQEKPIESFNEYLFALASHACYWESEDTALMILKEIYHLDGIVPHTPNTQQISKPGPYSSPAYNYMNQHVSCMDSGHGDQSNAYAIPGRTDSSHHSHSAPPLQGFVPTSPITHR